MALVLVTGVAGFLGSHLAQALMERGDTVRGLDNFATGSRKNLMGVPVEVRVADLADSELVGEACEGVETIFHLGALDGSIRYPRQGYDSNVNGTFHLLEGARAAGVRRVMYASSSAVYGSEPGVPWTETMRPEPVGIFAAQKLAGELSMQSYWQVYGMETICLRFSSVFGPRQRTGVIARFLEQMSGGETPVVLGDGEQTRDFMEVGDAVQACLKAAGAPAERVAGGVFNVGSGAPHSVNEAAGRLAGLLGWEGALQHGSARPGEVRDALSDISLARAAFGYAPEVGFGEGLARLVAWRTSLA